MRQLSQIYNCFKTTDSRKHCEVIVAVILVTAYPAVWNEPFVELPDSLFIHLYILIYTGDNLVTTPKGSHLTYVHQNIKNASLQET